MSDPAIIEAAERALDNCIEGYEARAVLAAVTPLIEAAALEKAAKVAEEEGSDFDTSQWVHDAIAAKIRALITDQQEKP